MSSIQLSDAMMQDLKTALQKYDTGASDDMVAVQYMSAAVGYLMSFIDTPGHDKAEVLSQLADFSVQVFEQMERDKQPARPAEDAFGIWKP